MPALAAVLMSLPIYYLEKTYTFFTDTLTDEVLEENFDILLFNRFIAGTNALQYLTQINAFFTFFNAPTSINLD